MKHPLNISKRDTDGIMPELRSSRLSNTCICFVALSLIIWTDCTTGSRKEENNVPGKTPFGLQVKDIIFIVLSQVNEFHESLATELKTHFENQLPLNKIQWPKLLFTHKDFLHVHGAWTILPLIHQIVNVHADVDTSWILICEEHTHINVSLLTAMLQHYKATEKHLLGRKLYDHETTIIHHFAFADNPSQFAYPDFGAGFVMSIALVKHLHHRLHTSRMKTDFSIDPKHEFALFVLDEGNGTKLTNVNQFCSADTSSDPNCITSQPDKFPNCGSSIDNGDLFVAVKTCQQFHESRIPVVKATWGKEAKVIEYFSEVVDKKIPTIDLMVPNTERGHCGKTMAIIQRAVSSPKLSRIKWVLIADDDTIINLDRLRALLACYNQQQPVALGERYGYGVVNGGGYDYITGGGGMVFSMPAVKLLAERCECYKNNAPDDMTLGMCLRSIGIPVTHSRYFHQARPEDYSKDFLANQLPVSFHKHWNNDPYKVYDQLLASSVVPGKAGTGRENMQFSTVHKMNQEL
uniref:Fringe-like glycosyltransferase domain-containing protein n=1 Tax=Arion vulgaris TaxID=1028688 RepID=A0A0B7A1S6_9EUPU